MDGAGQDRGHYLQGGEALLQGLAGQQHVGRLGHVRGVQVVVVGDGLQVVVLDSHQECQQGSLIDLEGFTKVPLLKYLECCTSQYPAILNHSGGRKYIQAPLIYIRQLKICKVLQLIFMHQCESYKPF